MWDTDYDVYDMDDDCYMKKGDNLNDMDDTDCMNNEPYTSLRDEVHELLHNKEHVPFNNGFTYKHGDTYTCHYGGSYDCMFDCGQNTWTNRDLRGIKRIVGILVAKHSYPVVVYTDYERTLKGTQKLYKFLRNNFVESRSYRKYMFGVILYHQLLYTSKLIGSYTTGEARSYFKVIAKLRAERGIDN